MNSVKGGTRRGGFTLVEAAISIVIVAVMLVAALTTVGSAAGGRDAVSRWRTADGLAGSLAAEIAQSSYGSTTGLVVGLPLGAVGDRTSWATLDDFQDLRESPPRARDGTVLSDYTGWTRRVLVERVSSSAPGGAAVFTDDGLKRVTIVVEDPRGRSRTRVLLRSRWGLTDTEPAATQRQACVIWLTLRMGDAGTSRPVIAGVALGNLPSAPEAVADGGADLLASPVTGGVDSTARSVAK